MALIVVPPTLYLAGPRLLAGTTKDHNLKKLRSSRTL